MLSPYRHLGLLLVLGSVAVATSCGGKAQRRSSGRDDAGESGEDANGTSGSGGKSGAGGRASTGGQPAAGLGGVISTGGTTPLSGRSGAAGTNSAPVGGAGGDVQTAGDGGFGGEVDDGGSAGLAGEFSTAGAGADDNGGNGGSSGVGGGPNAGTSGSGGAGNGGRAGGGSGGSGGGPNVLIDFDTLSNGDVITNQYAGVVFSTEAGRELRAHNPGEVGQSLPNMLCTAVVNNAAPECEGDVYLDFSPPVSSIRFAGIQANNAGQVATVYIYGGDALITSFGLTGGGPIYTMYSLGDYSGITRMEIRDINELGGIGWDDFSYVQ